MARQVARVQIDGQTAEASAEIGTVMAGFDGKPHAVQTSTFAMSEDRLARALAEFMARAGHAEGGTTQVNTLAALIEELVRHGDNLSLDLIQAYLVATTLQSTEGLAQQIVAAIQRILADVDPDPERELLRLERFAQALEGLAPVRSADAMAS